MNISGKTYFIIQFDGGYYDEWPDPFIIPLSKGKVTNIDDVVFYGSRNSVPREIRGGNVGIPCSSNESIVGPRDGYDDGELDGRALRASGFENFEFFEIDFDRIPQEIDEIEVIMLNYDHCVDNVQDKVIQLKNLQIFTLPLQTSLDGNDYSSLMLNFVSFINERKIKHSSADKSDVISIETSLRIGKFLRVSDSEWTYKECTDEITDFEDYLSNISEGDYSKKENDNNKIKDMSQKNRYTGLTGEVNWRMRNY